MAIEPVKIPQNVQVEDRIIGQISLRQIILCMIGGGISFAVWNTAKSMGYVSLTATIICWIPLYIIAAFAFVKFQGLSLLKIVLLFIEQMQKPPVRMFAPREGVAIHIRYFYQTQQEKDLPKAQTHVEVEKLKKLSSLLDEGVRNTDEEEEDKERHPVLRHRITVSTPGSLPADGVLPGMPEPKRAQTVAVSAPSKSTP
ncbi:MAG: PrgI family protein [Candidatus Peregrinibacteria bacterium]